MKRNSLDPELKDLPAHIPIFPLDGALLLPSGRLPLNIFEPRYLNMVSDTLSTPHRLIGMIQSNTGVTQDEMAPLLYSVGCVGRISSFEETNDGRYLISLDGMIRFHIIEEIEGKSGYRQCKVSYDKFADDMHVQDNVSYDRGRLIKVLKRYFQIKGFSADWTSIESCADEKLITTLCMICPLAVAEKQMLIEAKDISARGDLISTILEMECEMVNADMQKQGYVKH